MRSASRSLASILSALMLLLLLGACDGGIFGTGDGGDISTPVDADETGASGADSLPDAADTPEPDNSDTSNTSDSEDSDNSTDSEDSALEQRAFENLQTGSDIDTPLLSMVNLSQLNINAFSDAGTPLFESDVPAGAISPTVSVLLSSQTLSVIDADTRSLQLLLSPLNLGVSSVSTLIVRDRLVDSDTGSSTVDSEADTASVEILALPSRLSVNDNGLVNVRILQAYALADDARAAQMMLLPGGDSPGGSEVVLGTVSPASFQQIPEYRQVTSGSYLLQDSLQRFEPVPLTLEPGQSYTLILTGSDDVIMTVQDSEPDD